LAALAIYIHVPFCRLRCTYCDFASTAGQEALIPAYVEALGREIARQGRVLGRPAVRPDDGQVATVYLGGGTPSLLAPAQIRAILSACRAAFDVVPTAEVTLEANPGTVDAAYFAAIRTAGVNRLSLGVQSFDDGELALLGRIHAAAQAEAAYRDARAAGFDNVSLDLIYGLPGQSLHDWERSLAQAVALLPDHLSLYALEVHDDTPLGQHIAQGDLPAPDDDQAAAMYEHAEDVLAGAGFQHYEISNWARFVGAGPGSDHAEEGDHAGSPLRVCQHNLAYWRNEPYLGLGAAAHSWHGGERWWNVADPAAYIARVTAGQSPVAKREAIDRPTEMAETMFMGLRLVEEGVTFARFRERFGVDVQDVYREELRELQKLGLIAVQGDERVRLTRRGRLLGNEVFQRFITILPLSIDDAQHRQRVDRNQVVNCSTRWARRPNRRDSNP
jgi:oxygen-independent coproporphyrinogen-3 oxidase